MDRPHHHVVGAAAGVWLAALSGWPAWQTAAAAGIAAAAAPLPDLDNRRGWRMVDRVIPDEVLGHGGPMRHRGLLHWWALPAAAAVVVWLAWPWPGEWAAWAGLAGWASHLAGDLCVGARSPYRGPGVPLAPWWGHVGIGLHNGGVGNRVVVAVVAGSAVWAGTPAVEAVAHAVGYGG